MIRATDEDEDGQGGAGNRNPKGGKDNTAPRGGKDAGRNDGPGGIDRTPPEAAAAASSSYAEAEGSSERVDRERAHEGADGAAQTFSRISMLWILTMIFIGVRSVHAASN